MGIGFTIFPLSWHWGPWIRDKKSIFAVGPMRFVLHKQPGDWTP